MTTKSFRELRAQLDADPRRRVRVEAEKQALLEPALWASLLPGAFLLVGLVMLLSRLPVILLTNLWAEDGTVFYTEAYNYSGLHALLIPHTGYLQTFGRLEALYAIHFPVAWAPYFASSAALLVDVLPGAVFLSDRFHKLVPSRVLRVLIALTTIVLPGSYEVNGNLANGQWHLALLGFVLLLAPPRTRVGHFLDLAALIVVGLSGPFCVLLLPVAAVLAWRRGRWLLPRVAVLTASVAVQGLVYATHRGQRPPLTLAASGDLLVRILDRALLVPIMGTQAYLDLIHQPAWQWLWVPLAVLLVGAAVAAYSLWKGPLELGLLLFVGAGVTVFSLFGGLALPGHPLWPILPDAGGNFRYFYIPGVVWLTTLICVPCLAGPWPRGRLIRSVALGLLTFSLSFGILSDWRYAGLPPSGFRAAAEAFDRSPTGTVATLPIEPTTWTITLKKRR